MKIDWVLVAAIVIASAVFQLLNAVVLSPLTEKLKESFEFMSV